MKRQIIIAVIGFASLYVIWLRIKHAPVWR